MSGYQIPGGVVIKESEVAAYKREVLESCTLIRAEAAAEMLACSTRTLQTLVQENKLTPYSRNGSPRSKGLRFLAADLQQYVRTMRGTADDWRE